MAKAQRITAKQIAFAENVAAGMDLSASYRAVYSADKMLPASVHANACRLGANVKVIARIDEILAQNTEQKRVTGLSVRVKVLKRLEELMQPDPDTPKAVQLNATIWYGKTDSMFTDVTETNEKPQTTTDIDKEIEQRIKELENAARPRALKPKLVA